MSHYGICMLRSMRWYDSPTRIDVLDSASKLYAASPGHKAQHEPWWQGSMIRSMLWYECLVFLTALSWHADTAIVFAELVSVRFAGALRYCARHTRHVLSLACSSCMYSHTWPCDLLLRQQAQRPCPQMLPLRSLHASAQHILSMSHALTQAPLRKALAPCSAQV